jgi:undecaprenyl-diphosphatase
MICFLLAAAFRSSFSAVNLSINLWSASVNTGFFTLAAQTISIVFESIPLSILSFVVAVFLFLLHYRRYGLMLLGAMAGVTLLVALFKTVIMSPRPLNEIITATGYSFPSGHTTSIVVFFGVITYFVWKNWDSAKVKTLTGGLYVSITALIGFDRIYLNVHWFSDIVGSVFLGAFWLTLCILIFKYLVSSKRIQRFLSPNSRSENSALLAGCSSTQSFKFSVSSDLANLQE